MEKKIWSKPGIAAVQFAADEYISVCGKWKEVNAYFCDLFNAAYIMLETGHDPNNANYITSDAGDNSLFPINDVNKGVTLVEFFEKFGGSKGGQFKADVLYQAPNIQTGNEHTHAAGSKAIETTSTFEKYNGWYSNDTQTWNKAYLFLDRENETVHASTIDAYTNRS